MAIETTLLVITIIAVILVLYFLEAFTELLINAVAGLIILFVANLIFNLGIAYTFWSVLMCALGGIPGALLVIVLHIYSVAF